MGNIYVASLRIEATPVFKAILEGERTFMDLAKKYGVDIKVFEKVLREKVGDKEFERLQNASKSNWQKRRRKSDKPKKPKQSNHKRKPTTKRQKLIEQKAELAQKIESLTLNVEEEERNVAEAEEKVAAAESALENAKMERKAAKERLSGRNKKLAKKRAEYESVEKEIRKMDEENVYLVAPGYKGKRPDVGVFISVIAFAGVKVETGLELFKEPTGEEVLNSGFSSIEGANNAYNFARLVTKYQYEGIEATILVDDPRIVSILKNQGLEV